MEFITSIWNSVLCIIGLLTVGSLYIVEIVKEWNCNNSNLD